MMKKKFYPMPRGEKVRKKSSPYFNQLNITSKTLIMASLKQQKLFTLAVVMCFVGFQTKAACVYEQVIDGENLQIGTMLTWSTNFEDENEIFIIEKSENGTEFENIGNVKAAGDSQNLKNYNFLDIMAKSDRAYYRLMQVNTDGSSSYSDIVTVSKKFDNNFMVARMSAIATTNLFELTFDSFVDGSMNYSLTSIKGEVILENQLSVYNGLNELTIDLEDQKEGIFKLALNMGEETETIVLKKVADEIKKKPNVASTRKLKKN
jgi:hypothetical protein